MKEFYMIRVAVITKQDGVLNFAEEITVAFATLPEAEAYAEQMLQLNKEWIPHFGQEPISLMETRTLKIPDTPEAAIAVLRDLLENGEAHYAKFIGLEPVDTASELERIRRGTTS